MSPGHIQETDACEIRDLLDRLADKWSLLVVELPGERTRRFMELRREIAAARGAYDARVT